MDESMSREREKEKLLVQAIVEYIARWNVEIVYLLFLITVFLVFLIVQTSRQEAQVLFEVLGVKVTLFHAVVFLLAVNIVLLYWNQQKKEDVERLLRELLR